MAKNTKHSIQDQELIDKLLDAHDTIYRNEKGELFTSESYAKASGLPYEKIDKKENLTSETTKPE